MQRKTKPFSGNSPTPQGEVDYETWRLWYSQVARGNEEEEEKKSLLLQYLYKPALRLAMSAIDTDTAEAGLHLLDSVYGEVVDKD